MNVNIEQTAPYKVRLPVIFEVVSPLHIGTREGILRSSEFAFHNKSTYIIDENKWGEFLLRKDLIEDFVAEVSSGPFSISDYLEKTKIHGKEMEGVLREISLRSIPGGNENMREFRPFVRDANGVIFIPGTSIKGAMRTGVLHGILSKNTTLREEKEAWVKTKIDSLDERNKERVKKQFSHKILQEDILQKFPIQGAKEGSNRDILRCLTVRDAYPVGNIETRIIKLEFLSKSSSGSFYWSKKKRGPEKPLSIWSEAIVAGKFQTELIWDEALFHKFNSADCYINGLDGLLEMIWGMNNRIFEHEKQHYNGNMNGPLNDATEAAASIGRWYQKQEGSYLRLGFGSGMLSTTVDEVFSPQVRERIRNLFGHNRGGDPAPKSRRVWKKDNNQWLPMGWLKCSQPNVKPVHQSMKEPERSQSVVWETALLEWMPQDGTVSARFEGKKAIGKGKELVPDALGESLINRRKKVTARVVVEVLGNSFKIVRIDPIS